MRNHAKLKYNVKQQLIIQVQRNFNGEKASRYDEVMPFTSFLAMGTLTNLKHSGMHNCVIKVF